MLYKYRKLCLFLSNFTFIVKNNEIRKLIYFLYKSKFELFRFHKDWIKQQMNKNLHEQKKTKKQNKKQKAISYLVMNLPGTFWKMGKF